MWLDLETLIDLKGLDTLRCGSGCLLPFHRSRIRHEDLLAGKPERGPCSHLVTWEHAVKRYCQAGVTPPTRARTINMPSTARILLDVSTLPYGVLAGNPCGRGKEE